jgi:hypothetical protein
MSIDSDEVRNCGTVDLVSRVTKHASYLASKIVVGLLAMRLPCFSRVGSA